MKYITLTLMVMTIPTLQATQLSSWQQHSQLYLQSQSKKLAKQSGNFATVGSDNSCDYRVGNTKIQDAIDDGHTEIRIVSDTYPENLVINDRSISLLGGYANCLAASTGENDGQQVVVDAGGSGVVLDITSKNQRQTITIANMNFTNGLNGIAAIDADLELILNNVWLSSNNGGISSGGGLRIIDGNTDVFATDVLIASNTAWFGGGLLCNGENNSVFINKQNNFAGISINQATNGDGGGAWLTNGCVLSVYAGTNNLFPDLSGITGNNATGNGGGVAVTSGARLNLIGSQFCFANNCLGNNNDPVNLTANTADFDLDRNGDGGAIYAQGNSTEIYALTVNLYNNKAFNGGGIALENGAYVESRAQQRLCWSPDSCNQLASNEAFNAGGAVYVSSDSRAKFGPTHMYHNRADFGTAGFVTEANAFLEIEGSMIYKNGDNGSGSYADSRVFFINGTAITHPALILNHSTIVDNQSQSNVISNFSGTMNLLSSIVHESNGIDVYESTGSTSELIKCLIVHEDSSFPSGIATDTAVDDPMFIDRLQTNYHLNAAISPAVDYCDSFIDVPEYPDIDGEIRNWDDPVVGNLNGAYDIGADESYGNDVYFKDDFDN